MNNSTLNGQNGHSNGHSNGHKPVTYEAAIAIRDKSNVFEDVEAERAMVGAMMRGAAFIIRAASICQREDVHLEQHRTIWDAVVRLHLCGKKADRVTVASSLSARGLLEAVGGTAYLGDLADDGRDSESVDDYAELVREAADRRRVLGALRDVQNALVVDDKVTLRGAMARLQELQEVAPQESERFELQRWGSFKNLRRREQLIEGLLPEDGLSILFGEGGTYKSFMALDLALHLSTGRAWHGRQVLAGEVVYCAGEGIYGLRDRAQAWLNHYGLDDPGKFSFVTDVPRLCEPADTERLIGKIKALGEQPRLIIIDTLALALAGANENDTGDMGRAVVTCKRLMKETGGSVMVVHHTNRQGAIRGNMSLLWASDTGIEVKRQEDTVTLRCARQKDYDDFKPLSFKRQLVSLEHDSSLVFLPTEPVEFKKLLPKMQQKALDILRNRAPEGATREMWQFWAVEAGMPARTFRDVKNELLNAELVREDGILFLTVEP